MFVSKQVSNNLAMPLVEQTGSPAPNLTLLVEQILIVKYIYIYITF